MQKPKFLEKYKNLFYSVKPDYHLRENGFLYWKSEVGWTQLFLTFFFPNTLVMLSLFNSEWCQIFLFITYKLIFKCFSIFDKITMRTTRVESKIFLVIGRLPNYISIWLRKKEPGQSKNLYLNFLSLKQVCCFRHQKLATDSQQISIEK